MIAALTAPSLAVFVAAFLLGSIALYLYNGPMNQLEQQQKDAAQPVPSAAALAPAPPGPAVRQPAPAPARNAPHGR